MTAARYLDLFWSEWKLGKVAPALRSGQRRYVMMRIGAWRCWCGDGDCGDPAHTMLSCRWWSEPRAQHLANWTVLWQVLGIPEGEQLRRLLGGKPLSAELAEAVLRFLGALEPRTSGK